ncbi:MAG TPA: DUF2950 domain-containing protein [Roseiarcus sp.]|nr:DUF2950 domain-containing protein [Roseiarcus sp.]
MTKNRQGRRAPRAAIVGLFALASTILALSAPSAALAQQKYPTVEAAVDALVATAKSGDEKAALVVLGPNGEDIISSGDKVSDDAVRARFVKSYDAKHEIKTEGDKATLIIGENDYPFPIPLVRRAGKWSFDTDAGRIEILARRIGHNELDAIQTALAYVDAQEDYASKDRGAGLGVYAQHFLSEPGKKNGLYWATAQGEEESPLGELFAEATQEGYGGGGGRAPYHGYYYRILTKQGPHATGGAVDYVVNGKMIGGFGLVAYPAEYRNSGVVTFIVNHSGQLFQKDLGPDTANIAENIAAFDPDKSWKKVDTTAPPK